jgi:cytochrome c2
MLLLRTRIGLIVALVALIAVVSAIWLNQRSAHDQLRERAEALAHGSVARGHAQFIAKGCGGCHSIKRVPQAIGKVGPPLDGVGQRAIIAGLLENSPVNLAHWIRNPQSVAPGNAMPNLPMSDQDARDIAAFLYAES